MLQRLSYHEVPMGRRTAPLHLDTAAGLPVEEVQLGQW